jgi:hypothetical protein
VAGNLDTFFGEMIVAGQFFRFVDGAQAIEIDFPVAFADPEIGITAMIDSFSAIATDRAIQKPIAIDAGEIGPQLFLCAQGFPRSAQGFSPGNFFACVSDDFAAARDGGSGKNTKMVDARGSNLQAEGRDF